MVNVNYGKTKAKNGLTIVWSINKNINSVSLQLLGIVGSQYEDKTGVGTAHFAEHLKIFEKSEIINLLETGAHFAAVTSRFDVMYGFHVLKEDLPQCSQLLLNILHNNIQTINPENFENIKQQICNEITRYYANPEKFLGRIKNSTIFENTDSRLSMLNTGSINDVKKIKLSQVQNLIDNLYLPGNFVLAITGNVSSLDIKKIKYNANALIYKQNLQPTKKVKIDNEKNKKVYGNNINGTSYVSIDWFGYPIRSSKRWELAILAKLLEIVLKHNIKSKTEVTSFSTREYGLLTITALVKTNRQDEIIAKILEIKNSLENKITKELFYNSKKNLMTDILLKLEKPSLLASFIAELALHGKKNTTPNKEIAYIKNTSLKSIKTEAKKIKKLKEKITIVMC